jgi:hypothetical protein
MSDNVTSMLIELVKEVKEDIKAISGKVDNATVSIAVIETFQKAIDNLDLDERLRKVEGIVGESKGFAMLVKESMPAIAILISIWAILKH